jgi:mono/diheme cytochrome c family protein
MAIFFGGAYLGRFSGNFTGDSLDPALIPQSKSQGPHGPGGGQTQELSQADRGKKIFSANCATCHQASGLGVAGQYPPLAGSEYVLGGTKRLGMIVLKGLQGPLTVKGAQYGTAVMQPWDKTLTDAKIADVLTYIRQDWGNKAGPVSPAGIAALRKELGGHPDSYTEADLKAVPEDANLAGDEAAGAKPAEAPAPPK